MPEGTTPRGDRKSAQVIECTADSGAPLWKRVRNHMKTQGLQGCDKKQRSCNCEFHRRVKATLRIRGIAGDISTPNGSTGMRRSARQQRGAGGAGLGVDEGGSGVHGAR